MLTHGNSGGRWQGLGFGGRERGPESLKVKTRRRTAIEGPAAYLII